MKHTKTGNCFISAYTCYLCQTGEFCDVCHSHDAPRGDCKKCQLCKQCEAEEQPQLDTINRIANDAHQLACDTWGKASSDGGIEDGNRIHNLAKRLYTLIGEKCNCDE